MDRESTKKPFRVLSLDGGGMRGVYMAAFLRNICKEQSNRSGKGELDLGKGFDLIVGTSTGAIVGSAVAIGCPMYNVINLFREYGPKIFPHRIQKGKREIFRIFNRKSVSAGDSALRSALSNILGETTISDVFHKREISMCIPTIRMSTHKAWVFKKTPASGNRDDEFTLTDICMASSAAPIYRSLAGLEIPDSNTSKKECFADGGLWANNPILVALIDAINITKLMRPIEIFSLGTCPRPDGEQIESKDVHRSMYDWTFGADVIPLSINAQEFAFDNMARFLSRSLSEHGFKISTVRFPTGDVPACIWKYLGLDDTREEAMNSLISQAETDSHMTLSACDDPENSDGQKINSLLRALPCWNQDDTLFADTTIDSTRNV